MTSTSAWDSAIWNTEEGHLPPPLATTIGGFESGNQQYANIKDKDDSKPLDLVMVTDLKNKFTGSEFESKYHNILAKSTDPIIKSETVKLSTAAIINTLRQYFKSEDPDDETSMSIYLSDLVNDNKELAYCIEKLNKHKNKTENNKIIKENNNNSEIEIDIIVEDDIYEKDTTLTKILLEKKEAAAYYKTKLELEKLINKRRNEISGIFVQPDQNELDRIFKTKISETGKGRTKDNDNDIEETENTQKYGWCDAVELFTKYEISPTAIALLTSLNEYKKELNDTHSKFKSIQNTVNKFSATITSQLNWLSNMPDCIDGSIIVNNIEKIIEKYFDKENIVKLFKDYKTTYHKLMMLISFAPREFMPKNTCAVCLTDPIDLVFVPCGHTCCSDCSSTISSCMVCRTKIDKKQKIYNI